ncbi:alpha/beta fold hydrolase [Legionella brunensis]|uniref:Pimeloyl-[acyl-carrier protein] methyl ester esterase n=1 Tax=Legionella brunensis TaxID=29422 RepID=A0A0W0STV4_9GAMM|nr:alpha/beta fold hydrolase [Legionella brunensis]KTC86806.1 biotin biosynthesis protein BioH [Legionella brunensis]
MNLNIKVRGQGKALVFLHGWGFDHKVWLNLVDALEQKYTLYLVDLPGFGLSPLMDWPHFKTDLLKHLPAHFAVVGWSMGGLFASRLALEIPERTTHLFNVASSPRFIKEENWPGVEPLVFDNFLRNLVTNPQQTISEFVGLQLQNQNYEYRDQILPDPVSLEAGLTILADWDLREQLYHFKKPTTYLFGRLDAITPRATMAVMQKNYPSFNYIMFSKAAHMPFLSHKEEFLTILESLLK